MGITTYQFMSASRVYGMFIRDFPLLLYYMCKYYIYNNRLDGTFGSGQSGTYRDNCRNARVILSRDVPEICER